MGLLSLRFCNPPRDQCACMMPESQTRLSESVEALGYKVAIQDKVKVWGAKKFGAIDLGLKKTSVRCRSSCLSQLAAAWRWQPLGMVVSHLGVAGYF